MTPIDEFAPAALTEDEEAAALGLRRIRTADHRDEFDLPVVTNQQRKAMGIPVVAGPMRGYPEFNFPAFHAAAADLRERGWAVFSPAERDLEEDGFDPKTDAAKSIDYYMQFDLPAVCRADAVIVLPGWEKSQGARLECYVANEVGKQVLTYPDLKPVENVRKAVRNGEMHAEFECLTAAIRKACEPLTGRDLGDEHEEPRRVVGVTKEIRPAPGGCVHILNPVFEGETRVVNEATGGAKGRKQQRYSLLPWDVLDADAELYGRGAAKYEERNWERGYAWSLSFDAALRHIEAFWQSREALDPETGCHHLASARFHLAALMRFEREHPALDDRPAARHLRAA